MGAKKKTEATIQPPAHIAQEKLANSIIILKSSDGTEFKVNEELLLKYSTRLRGLIEESLKKDTVNLSQYDKDIVQQLVQFINLHKQKQPTKIQTPIKTNQNLKFIMEQADAQYIDKIVARGDNFVFQMLQISSYLQIEHLRRRLACGVAIKLMKSTLEQLKQEYQIQDDFGEDELRSQMRTKLESLRYNQEQQ